jgi:hypothetical protein
MLILIISSTTKLLTSISWYKYNIMKVKITTEWLQQERITHVRQCHRDSSQFKPCKSNHLTTWHSWVTKTPRVGIVHDAIKETIRAHLTLVHIFHTIPWWASVGGPCTILMYTWRYGRIAFISATHKASKFVGPHKSRMCQYVIKLAY